MKNSLLKPLTAFCILLICAISLARVSMPATSPSVETTQEDKKAVVKKTPTDSRPYADPSDMREPADWRKSSQIKPYPKVKHAADGLTIRVSLKGNRVYLLRAGHVVYTMRASGGAFKKGRSSTPTGTFRIQTSRGRSFYNPKLNEGANYWTSFDKTDNFLFHSVPTKGNGKYNRKEARKLGVKAASHGCIRLSVADARWLMKNIPAGTEVIIKNN